MAAGVASRSHWRRTDRLFFYLSWLAGVSLCVLVIAIVAYMGVRGIEFLGLDLLIERPVEGTDQSRSGGLLDPILGTLLVTAIGIGLAAPVGIATAVWLTEYGKPAPLARAIDSGVEVVAGIPSIVFALFGLAIFGEQLLGFLSVTTEGGGALGRSFLIAGLMMAFIALPLVVASTREALLAIPSHVREASYALGKTRAATIRAVLLPASRPGIATGVVLGMGRIIGDTAIIIFLLGATAQISPREDQIPGLDVLQGTGQTLTSFVYNCSPAGECNSNEKAYAAAFILLLLVIVMNSLVDLITRRGEMPQWIR